MSIDAEIGKHISSQTLFVIAPAQPGKPSIRDVIVTKEIWEMVRDDATPPDAVSHVWGRARAKLDAIASGGVLLFGLDPFNKSIGSNVARTHPISSGILDVRIRDPKPALRIFGGAAKKDAIVLVSFAYRDNLNFQKEVSRARGLWDMLFPKHSPMIGDGHDDYFSNLLPG